MTTREIRFGLDSILPGATTSSIGRRADSTTATLMRFNRGESGGYRTSAAGAAGAVVDAPGSALGASSFRPQPASASTVKVTAASRVLIGSWTSRKRHPCDTGCDR